MKFRIKTTLCLLLFAPMVASADITLRNVTNTGISRINGIESNNIGKYSNLSQPFSDSNLPTLNPHSSGNALVGERLQINKGNIEVKRVDYSKNRNNVYNKKNVSYLTIKGVERSIHSQAVGGGGFGNTSYGKRGNNKPNYTTPEMPLHVSQVSMKPYNAADRKPFQDDEATIVTGERMDNNWGGPPKPGAPIGDLIFPLLLLAGIYVLKLRGER